MAQQSFIEVTHILRIVGRALSVVTMAALLLVPTTDTAHAAFRRIATIQFSNVPLIQFDISWFDAKGKMYYLADRSNAKVQIFDATTNTYEGGVSGFTGFDPVVGTTGAGPNGIVVIDNKNELWATDGDSTVKIIDLATRQIVETISTGGTKRADEMAYDPRDQIMMIANNAEPIPFITFIDASVTPRVILGRLDLPDTAADGLEQPIFHDRLGKFLLAVPETPTNPQGEIKVIDPFSMTVVDVFPIAFGRRRCSPHGLVEGPRDEILIGCSRAGADLGTVIMDALSGAIVADISQVGASDQVWFNRGNGYYYLGARNMVPPQLGVIDSLTNTWLLNIQTTPAAHSVAASRRDDRVYVPLTPTTPPDAECVNGCIGVYADEN